MEIKKLATQHRKRPPNSQTPYVPSGVIEGQHNGVVSPLDQVDQILARKQQDKWL